MLQSPLRPCRGCRIRYASKQGRVGVEADNQHRAGRLRAILTSANKLSLSGSRPVHRPRQCHVGLLRTLSPDVILILLKACMRSPAEPKLALRMDECRSRLASGQSPSSVPHSAVLGFLSDNSPSLASWHFPVCSPALLTRHDRTGAQPSFHNHRTPRRHSAPNRRVETICLKVGGRHMLRGLVLGTLWIPRRPTFRSRLGNYIMQSCGRALRFAIHT